MLAFIFTIICVVAFFLLEFFVSPPIKKENESEKRYKTRKIFHLTAPVLILAVGIIILVLATTGPAK